MSKKKFVPAYSGNAFSYALQERSSHLSHVTVRIDSRLLAHVHDHVTRTYSNYTLVPGVSCRHLPLTYTQQYFSREINRDVQKFIYDHFVREGIESYLDDNNIISANWPRLSSISGTPQEGLTYTFAVSRAPNLAVKGWSTQTFLSPKRKNYTDLDAQVESFIGAITTSDDFTPATTIQPNDWVCFNSHLTCEQTGAKIPVHKEFWMHIAPQEMPEALSLAFLNKKKGDTFPVDISLIDNTPQDAHTGYSFSLTIQDIVSPEHLSEKDLFSCFNVEDHSSLHDRLIEVFSFRNDISLRRSIIEELFYRLLNAYRFDVAPHAITRRKEALLSSLQNNPDMTVYTRQKEFITHITRMAEANLKEEAIVDAIAQEEHINVTPRDIAHYLRMTGQERLRDFLYFTPIDGAIDATSTPIPACHLRKTVRREKTLNMMIKALAV